MYDILEDLAGEGRLKANDFYETRITKTDVKEISRLKYCLEMSNNATTLEERKALVEATTPVERKKAAEIISNKIAFTLLLYEGNAIDGSDMMTAFKTKQNMNHSKYDQLGGRILKLKKNIRIKQGLPDKDVMNCKLQSLDSVKEIQKKLSFKRKDK